MIGARNCGPGWRPELYCPGRRIRRILHNIGAFDPDSRLINLRGTFGRPLFSRVDAHGSMVYRSTQHSIDSMSQGDVARPMRIG